MCLLGTLRSHVVCTPNVFTMRSLGIWVLAPSVSDKDFTISVSNRVAQLILERIVTPPVTEVPDLIQPPLIILPERSPTPPSSAVRHSPNTMPALSGGPRLIQPPSQPTSTSSTTHHVIADVPGSFEGQNIDFDESQTVPRATEDPLVCFSIDGSSSI